MMVTWLQISIGAVVGATMTLAWAVIIYGPEQYELGGLAKSVELDAATYRAAKEIADEADRAAFLRRQCRERGGLYNFGSGECIER